MSSSNCCFLTCIQVSQEAGQVVWYAHIFQNFPQFVVIHTVKGFGIVNKAEINVFLELSCFSSDPGIKWSEVAQSCLTLCNPVDCSLPGSSVHGILQARILEWVAISFSRGSSQPRDRTWVSRIGGRCFNLSATREALNPAMWGIKCMSLSTTQARSVNSQVSYSMCDSWEKMSMKDHSSLSWWQGQCWTCCP